MSFDLCVIGCGEIATGHHGPAYVRYAQEHSGVRLAGCCSRHIERAAEFCKRFGFDHPYADFREMLRAEQPDAVCLNVPPAATCQIACEVLRMGLPLLLEKPPGMTVAETDQMIAAAAEARTPNQVAFNRRHTPLVQELKKTLDRIFRPNEIQSVRYDLTRVNRTNEDFSTTAIHGIDTVRFLLGSDYTRVRFHYQELPGSGLQAGNVFLDATFASGAAAQLAFCPLSGAVAERAVLHAAGHTWYLNLPIWKGFDSPGRLMHFADDHLVEDLSGPDLSGSSEDYILNGFYSEDASFFDDIRAGRSPRDNLNSGRQSVEIAQLMREQAPECVFPASGDEKP